MDKKTNSVFDGILSGKAPEWKTPPTEKDLKIFVSDYYLSIEKAQHFNYKGTSTEKTTIIIDP